MNTEDCVTVPRNSDFREHSRNSLESVAGEAQVRLREQRSLEKALDSELHSNISEYREHSHKLQDNGKPTDKDSAATRVKRTFSRDMHLQHSECPATFSKLADTGVCRSSSDSQCRRCQDYSSKQ